LAVRYSHIACCIDESEASMVALTVARELRGLAPGRLSLVHVAPRPLLFTRDPDGTPVADPEDLWAVEGAWLRSQARAGEEPVLLEGSPPGAVTEWAATAEVDLLVAAAHRTMVQRVLLGSFAAYLAHHAPCSVLLVRHAPAGRPAT
jgi:nucleotide-binding universal stress UspA family protein